MGKGWDGVQRYTKADIAIGAPLEGGKTTGGIPNSKLVVFEMAGILNSGHVDPPSGMLTHLRSR